MDRRVELLLAGTQTAAHDLFETRGAKFGAELVSRVFCGKRSNQAVQQIQVRSEIVGCIPFDTANIWGSGHWRPRRREVSLAVRVKIGRMLLREGVVRLGVGLREGDHIQVVQENPEDLFGHIGDFFAPHSIRASLVYIGDERYWLVVIFQGRVSEVRENSLGAFGWHLIRRGSRELCEDEVDNDSPGRELARAFLFLVEQHL